MNVNWKTPPVVKEPESNATESPMSLVTVWVVESVFSQVTAPPTATWKVAGLNGTAAEGASFTILTSDDRRPDRAGHETANDEADHREGQESASGVGAREVPLLREAGLRAPEREDREDDDQGERREPGHRQPESGVRGVRGAAEEERAEEDEQHETRDRREHVRPAFLTE